MSSPAAVPDRVAVHVGAGTVRVAGAVTGGAPWVVAELAGGAPVAVPKAIEELLAGLFAARPAELLLVHPNGWPPPRDAGWAGLADVVRAVPVAAAAADGAQLVLDVGHRGAEAALLGADGWPVLTRACAVGGARLDETVLDLLRAGRPGRCDPEERAAAGAEARRVREALSLLPVACARLPGAGTEESLTARELRTALAGALAPVVDAVAAVLAAAVDPAPRPVVRLIGGVARTPLLAELLDAARVGDVVVAGRPDTAAVLGALRMPPPPAVPAGPAAPVAAGGAGPPRWLAPLPARRQRPLRAALITTGGTATAAVLIVAGTALAPTAPEAPDAVPAGLVAQYGYRMQLPDGWAHTGGLPERRRTLLTPVAAPEGSDLISVERTPLGYDAGAEPERARAELRAAFDAAVAAGSRLSGFNDAGSFAGRPVAQYRQRGADGRTVVDWYVLLEADAQLSVGCQHTAAGVPEVRRACEVVVASVATG